MTRTRLAIAGLSLVVVLAVVLLFRAGAAQPTAAARGGEPYRVEMVTADPYKVQTALNSMAREGWFFVSAVRRNDGKVLLVFRHTQ